MLNECRQEEFFTYGIGNQHNGYLSECLDSDSVLQLVNVYRLLCERDPFCPSEKTKSRGASDCEDLSCS